MSPRLFMNAVERIEIHRWLVVERQPAPSDMTFNRRRLADARPPATHATTFGITGWGRNSGEFRYSQTIDTQITDKPPGHEPSFDLLCRLPGRPASARAVAANHRLSATGLAVCRATRQRIAGCSSKPKLLDRFPEKDLQQASGLMHQLRVCLSFPDDLRMQ